MGFNGGSQQETDMFGAPKKGGQESAMRDTLGFLKRSEEEKKRKEEEKKLALTKKDATYKLLSEINHNLSGYDEPVEVPYSLGQTLPASVRSQLKQHMKIEMVS
jgi:hypothetical protein